MKKVFLVLGGFVILLFLLRFFTGNEDAWICQNGAWVKHGNPSAPMPTSGCGKEEIRQVVVEGDPKIAENFIKNAPTYKFDGFDLTFVSSKKGDCQNCFLFIFTFQSRQADYGDRTGQILAQVITDHGIVVETENDKVVKAVIDGVWDELKNERI